MEILGLTSAYPSLGASASPIQRKFDLPDKSFRASRFCNPERVRVSEAASRSGRTSLSFLLSAQCGAKLP